MTESTYFWDEDRLYGSYEVRLTVDVGNVDEVLRIANLMRTVAPTMGGLGWRYEVVNVVGADSARTPPRTSDEV